ncbi:MAG: Tim44 domain-containing protein [Sulfuritalea sp.]|nr:Tim44-like domain-containing protein [Sulfuritalea sp.]MBN8476005.1 Tim44 domain-containing protein [Sulfuritalea sp.]
MKLAIAAFAIVVGLGMTPQDAEAKRLGSGKSFGMQRQASPAAPAAAPTQAAKPAAPAAAPAAAATPPKQGMSRFLGPLAGLAAGLGIAALLSHFGLGEGMASFLMIALLVFAAIFVVRLLMRKREPQPAMQYAGAAPGASAPTNFTPVASQFEAGPSGVGAGGTASAAAAGSIPADFDVPGFLRQAKLNFIRLQAANDRGDMDDIRQFTAPELYAEIEMQYRERGSKAQETDVQQLDAEVLEVVSEGGNHIASVRFHGTLREDDAAPEAFAEVWHLTKPTDGSRGWAIAGIQQVQ